MEEGEEGSTHEVEEEEAPARAPVRGATDLSLALAALSAAPQGQSLNGTLAIQPTLIA